MAGVTEALLEKGISLMIAWQHPRGAIPAVPVSNRELHSWWEAAMFDTQGISLLLAALTTIAAIVAAIHYRRQTSILERQERRAIIDAKAARVRAMSEAARADTAEQRADRAEQRAIAAEARAWDADTRARAGEARLQREDETEEAIWRLVTQVRNEIEAAPDIELPECEIEEEYMRLAEMAIVRGYLRRGSRGPRFVVLPHPPSPVIDYYQGIFR